MNLENMIKVGIDKAIKKAAEEEIELAKLRLNERLPEICASVSAEVLSKENSATWKNEIWIHLEGADPSQ